MGEIIHLTLTNKRNRGETLIGRPQSERPPGNPSWEERAH